IRQVLDDRVHALVADYPFCVLSVLRYPDQGLVAVMTPLTYEPIGIALPAADPLLINWLENFLGMLEGSGEMDYLKQRWFESSSWLELLP
ncbi:MAG TPA: transporter substrate-binding domain-containing protein, partial [Desulfosarcina sp.]|nr:transporter substrate-binding domain-containing protein [Desulfosarcina sp.]